MNTESVIGDYVTLQRGTTYKGQLVGAPGPALLGLGSITPGGGFRPDYKTYGGDCPPEITLYPGDLFVSLKGATKDGEMIGSVARVPETVLSGRLTQDTVKLAFGAQDDDFERYLYWLLRTPDYRHYCGSRASGSAVVALSREDFLSYAVPPMTEWKRQLAKTLDAIESKIDSNLRTVTLLSGLIDAMYRTVMESSPVTRVPLLEIVEPTKGVSYKSADLQPSRTALVTLKSFDRTGGYKADGLKPYVGGYKRQQVIQPGELALAQTDLTQGAEVVGRVIRVPASPFVDVMVASLDLIILRPKGDLETAYLFALLSDDEFREHCRARTSGTTVLHLAADALTSYSAPIVAAEARRGLVREVTPILTRVDQLRDEAGGLIELRDVLLSMLPVGKSVERRRGGSLTDLTQDAPAVVEGGTAP